MFLIYFNIHFSLFIIYVISASLLKWLHSRSLKSFPLEAKQDGFVAELIVAINKKFVIITLQDKFIIWIQGLQTKHRKEWERKSDLSKCSLERPIHRQTDDPFQKCFTSRMLDKMNVFY